MKIRLVLWIAICLGLLNANARAQVVINELLYMPDVSSGEQLRMHQWLELFNKGVDAVSLSSYVVSGRDGQTGASARPLPAATIPSGGYLVVHFTSGQNRLDFSDGTGDYYTGDDPASPLWNPAMDEAALYSASGIVDFVSWTSAGTAYSGGAAHDNAVTANIWTAGESLSGTYIANRMSELPRVVKPGVSIGRDGLSTDTNTKGDFDGHGGRHALGITPGRQNADDFRIGAIPAVVQRAGVLAVRARTAGAAPAPPKKWTVLLYFAGDNSLSEPLYEQLRQVRDAGALDGNINYVVMYDYQQLDFNHLDPNGKPAVIASSTVRGLLNNTDGYIVPQGEDFRIGNSDTGDPKELNGFIKWAKMNFPAEKYALIISSHGDGWKGVSQDESSPGARQPDDWLYMGELSIALQDQTFDLIAFHACLMAGLEVAYQVAPFAQYMVASEEIMYGHSFPYSEMVAALHETPDLSGDGLGKIIVDASKAREEAAQQTSNWTISLIDLKQVQSLVTAVDDWAKQLRSGVKLFLNRDIATDNVQLAIRQDSIAATRFVDDNFVDLGHFATNVMNDAGIPACVKTAIPNVLKILDKDVVIRQAHGSGVPLVHGVHIYFPTIRTVDMGSVLLKPITGTNQAFPVQPYDGPGTRIQDGNSRLAAYAPNADQLPLQSRDEERFDSALPADQLKAPAEWPRSASPGLRFVQSGNTWPLFLQRYYKPVADNHILDFVAADGTKYPVVSRAGGPCENPTDFISVPVGSSVKLSGRGSSDADMPQGADRVRSPNPMYYFWDLNAAVGRPVGVFPTQVDNADAALFANTNMDQEQDQRPTTWDQNNGDGPQISFPCVVEGFFVTTLMPWDDNHLFRFHNTSPSGAFVHPNTDSDQSGITCLSPPTWNLRQPGQYYRAYKAPVQGTLTNSDGSPAANAPVTATPTGGNPIVETIVPPGGIIVPPGGTGFSTQQGSRALRATVRQASAPLQLRTDSTGSILLGVTPQQPGPGEITLTAAGVPPQKISFNVIAPNDGPGAGLQLAGPSSLTMNTPATITATVIGQNGPVSSVSMLVTSGNATFNDNARFAANAGTQASTDPNGLARASLTPTAGGIVQIVATTGSVTKTLSIPVNGGSPPPDSLQVAGVPVRIAPGAPGAIVATVTAGGVPSAGVSVRFQVSQGSIAIAGAPANVNQIAVSTNSAGMATMNYAANDSIPVRLIVTVAGTTLTRTVSFVVSLPAR